MEDVYVNNGEHKVIGFVDGNLIVGNNAIIDVEGQQLKVTGMIRCEGSARFNGNILAREFTADNGDIHINGNMNIVNRIEVNDGSLFVVGTLVASEVNVDNKLFISNDLKAKKVDAGGRIRVSHNLEASNISVGGSLNVEGNVTAESISVGGSIEVKGRCNIHKVDVGGSAKFGSGKINVISVGGKLSADSDFHFERASVGGIASFQGNLTGGNLSVGGVVKVMGDAQLTNMSIGGMAKFDSSCSCKTLKVGGVLSVGASLNVDELLAVGGDAKINGPITAAEVKVGNSIKAKKIDAKLVYVGGKLLVDKYVKSDEVKIGKEGQIRGIVIALDVLIREKAKAEDIYSRKIVVRRFAVVNSLYGDLIYLENCKVNGDVYYTEKLEVKGNVKFAKEPKKVNTLPAPPKFD